MRFRRYWVREWGQVRIGDEVRWVHVHGSSDVSEADARADALHRIAQLGRRIAGDPEAFSDYEVAIREEVLETLDARNVVTRTRNGTQVLNSEDTVFIDIDRPPRSFWKSLFAWRGLPPKERIVVHLRELAGRARYAGLGIRVYETRNGIRAILTGKVLAADSDETAAILADFNADTLYARLCRRQGCFRARLTPKPRRAGCGTLHVAFPRDDKEQAALDAWLPEYERAASRFATCRFREDIGNVTRSRVIDFHDRATQAFSVLPLA